MIVFSILSMHINYVASCLLINTVMLLLNQQLLELLAVEYF